MAVVEINLPDHLRRFVDDQVRAGQYRDANEMIGVALGILQQSRDEEHERIQRFIEAAKLGQAAIDNGDYVDVQQDKISEYLDQIKQRALRRLNGH